MSNRSIYLCGPITGLSHDEARLGWRKQVLDALKPHDIDCLSPMRFKDHLAEIQNLSANGYGNNVFSSPRGITARDRYDTCRADMIFCNLLDAKIVSIGSMIEFGWADAFRVPLVVCMEEEGNVHDHAMVNEIADFVVPSVEAGIEVVKAILIPGV